MSPSIVELTNGTVPSQGQTFCVNKNGADKFGAKEGTPHKFIEIDIENNFWFEVRGQLVRVLGTEDLFIDSKERK